MAPFEQSQPYPSLRKVRSVENLTSSLRQTSNPLRRLSKSFRPGHRLHSHSSPGRLNGVAQGQSRRPSLRAAARDTARLSRETRSPSPKQKSDGRIGTTTSPTDAPASQDIHTHLARNLVSAVVEIVPGLEDVARHLQSAHPGSPEQSGSRVSHVRRFLSAGSNRSSKAVADRDRIRFICACLSLAKDFEIFRAQHPHRRALSTSCERPDHQAWAGASADDLHDAFVASQTPVDEDEKNILDAAVRFGTKMRVADAIGKALELGSGFALACAYEYFSLRAFPHRAFAALRLELRQSWAACNGIRCFSLAVDDWWQGHFATYQHRLGAVMVEKKLIRSSKSAEVLQSNTGWRSGLSFHQRSTEVPSSALPVAPSPKLHASFHTSQALDSASRLRKDSTEIENSSPFISSSNQQSKGTGRSQTPVTASPRPNIGPSSSTRRASPRSRFNTTAISSEAGRRTSLKGDREVRQRPPEAETNKQKRRSLSLDSAQDLGQLHPVQQLQGMPLTLEVPHRSSRRPRIDAITPVRQPATPRSRGHRKSMSVDRAVFERPRKAPSPPTKGGIGKHPLSPQLSDDASGKRPSPSRPALDTLRRNGPAPPPPPAKDPIPKQPTRSPVKAESSQRKPLFVRQPPTYPRSRFVEHISETDPVRLSEPKKQPERRAFAALASANHILTQWSNLIPMAHRRLMKTKRGGERPAQGSVAIHLPDLLQGMEEHLNPEAGAMPTVQCSA